jgi:hypothetical protein
MSTRSRWAILGGGFGLYLIGLGFLGGIVAERVRFDHQRLAVLGPYDEALRTWQGYLMRLEKGTAAAVQAGEDPWTHHVRQVNEALAREDTRAAELAWREVYALALRGQRWEDLLEAGHLYLRMGEAAEARRLAEPQARDAYLRAMVRARAAGSVEGVLRATEAFARLGDREVAEHGLRIAERMAAQARAGRVDDRSLAFGVRPVGLDGLTIP